MLVTNPKHIYNLCDISTRKPQLTTKHKTIEQTNIGYQIYNQAQQQIINNQ